MKSPSPSGIAGWGQVCLMNLPIEAECPAGVVNNNAVIALIARIALNLGLVDIPRRELTVAEKATQNDSQLRKDEIS
jgi:hypothetical protein